MSSHGRCGERADSLVSLFKRFIYFYLSILGCAGSSLLWAFSSCSERWLLCCDAWASHCFSFCSFSFTKVASLFVVHRLQQLWHMGLAARWYVGSSQTRHHTRAPCLHRWILHHWTTREALVSLLIRTLIPSWGPTLMTSSNPDYLPKAPSTNTLTLEVRASKYDVCGEPVQSIANLFGVCSGKESPGGHPVWPPSNG